MKSLSRNLCVAIVATVSAGAHGAAPAWAAAEKDVRVVNTPAEPVPTTAVGVTAVSGTVEIGNPLTAPVPTVSVNDGREPLQVRVTMSIPDGSTQEQAEIEVPAGKRLVIEHASARAQGAAGQGFIAQVQTSVFADGSTRGVHWLVFRPQGTFSGIDVFTAAQPMRVYADPSTPPVVFIVTRTTSIGSAFAELTLSGYLVETP